MILNLVGQNHPNLKHLDLSPHRAVYVGRLIVRHLAHFPNLSTLRLANYCADTYDTINLDPDFDLDPKRPTYHLTRLSLMPLYVDDMITGGSSEYDQAAVEWFLGDSRHSIRHLELAHVNPTIIDTAPIWAPSLETLSMALSPSVHENECLCPHKQAAAKAVPQVDFSASWAGQFAWSDSDSDGGEDDDESAREDTSEEESEWEGEDVEGGSSTSSNSTESSEDSQQGDWHEGSLFGHLPLTGPWRAVGPRSDDDDSTGEGDVDGSDAGVDYLDFGPAGNQGYEWDLDGGSDDEQRSSDLEDGAGWEALKDEWLDEWDATGEWREPPPAGHAARDEWAARLASRALHQASEDLASELDTLPSPSAPSADTAVGEHLETAASSIDEAWNALRAAMAERQAGLREASDESEVGCVQVVDEYEVSEEGSEGDWAEGRGDVLVGGAMSFEEGEGEGDYGEFWCEDGADDWFDEPAGCGI